MAMDRYTQDIVASVHSVTAATQDATKAMQQVSAAPERTADASAKMLTGANDLARDADTLRGEVTHFLAAMASTSEAGRRKYERIDGNGVEVMLRLPDGASRRVPITVGMPI